MSCGRGSRTPAWRPGGHLLSVEPDVTGLLIPDTAPEEQDLEQRWVTMMRKRGNDPALGRQLAAVLAKAGFGVDAAQDRVDELAVDRSPAWTARHALLADQLATEDDIRRWESAISHRLSTTREADRPAPGLLRGRRPSLTRTGRAGRRLGGTAERVGQQREKEAGAAGGESGARAHGPALGGRPAPSL